jgi:hypothetical protein
MHEYVLTIVRLLHKHEYSGQILEVLKDEPWTTTNNNNNKNHNNEMEMKVASISPAVPPGAGLKRTQSRNARRKLARQHKKAKQEPLDQPQARYDDDESDNDNEEDDKDSNNSTGDSSSDDSSDDSSDSSSSSSDDDAPPTETFNVSHKRPQLYYDATTRQPYRVYRGRLELEAAEIDLPGGFPLRVPVPSATTPFTHESIAAGTRGERPHEPRVAFARPFNSAPYTLVPTQLSKLQRGQVVRFGMLAIKPGEMVPSFEPNLCALVLEVPPPPADKADNNNGGGGKLDETVTVQLASQFISLEPAANRFAPAPPRYDYGVRELTPESGISDLRIYEGVPPLAIYPSMLFEAELNDD